MEIITIPCLKDNYAYLLICKRSLEAAVVDPSEAIPVKKMVSQKWGRIVNIGSVSSYYGYKSTSLYCASKHALLGFSRAIHDELKQYNVRTFSILPSSTQSEIGLQTKNQDYSTFLNPIEIANYVVFVVSHNNNLISKEILLERMVIK